MGKAACSCWRLQPSRQEKPGDPNLAGVSHPAPHKHTNYGHSLGFRLRAAKLDASHLRQPSRKGVPESKVAGRYSERNAAVR